MATSGSIDFSVSRDDLIKTALQYIGAIGEGETPTTDQTSECAILLNMLVKARMVDGMPLWAVKTGYILPQTGITTIALGATGDHATLSYSNTVTTAASVAGTNTIVVSSTTGFTNGFFIGIELSTGDIQWTTINGAPMGSTITLTANLTAAVSAAAQVFAYQTKLQRPLDIQDAYILNVIDEVRHPINIIAVRDILSFGDLTSESIPNQIAYDPQLINGVLYIVPRFDTGDNVIQIRFHRPFEDFDASTDTPDFPQEFYLSLMVGLAALCGPKFGVDVTERQMLLKEAEFYFEKALGSEPEQTSLNIQPDVGC